MTCQHRQPPPLSCSHPRNPHSKMQPLYSSHPCTSHSETQHLTSTCSPFALPIHAHHILRRSTLQAHAAPFLFPSTHINLILRRSTSNAHHTCHGLNTALPHCIEPTWCTMIDVRWIPRAQISLNNHLLECMAHCEVYLAILRWSRCTPGLRTGNV